MARARVGLAVIETHPIQYHAPVYRALQQQFDIPVTAIYGSDCSVAGYLDKEFGAAFAWDTDLLSGYTSMFLSRAVANSTARAGVASTRGLGGALRQAAPEAVLLVGYSPRFHQVAFWEAWRTGRPMLFRAETTDHRVERTAAKSFVRDALLRRLYGTCERLLYVGERSRSHFHRLGYSGETLVSSPYCVDLTAFQCDEAARAQLRTHTRSRLGIADTRTVLLFSGKLSDRKAPDLLLAAAAAMSPSRETAVLFLGSGDLQVSLEQFSRAHPELPVRFLGFQNQSQLSQYYHAADLLVLPSRHSETWGLVVNEALHHGLPCVVSDAVGCAPDLIAPETGCVFEAGSVSSLTKALDRALLLTARPAIRESCRRKVAAYTVERAAAGIAEAYAAVCKHAI